MLGGQTDTSGSKVGHKQKSLRITELYDETLLISFNVFYNFEGSKFLLLAFSASREPNILYLKWIPVFVMI
jgi:hypothetical protein